MDIRENKAIINNWFCLLNQRQITSMIDLYSEEIIVHSEEGQVRVKKEQVESNYLMLCDAFSDFQIIVDELIGEGDKVVSLWTITGTHTGDFLGLPPSGKPVKMMGISIDRIREGKIFEIWSCKNDLGLLTQLGILQSPGYSNAKE